MRTILKSHPAALLALLAAVSGPVSAFGEESFITGVDISELTAQENSGAGYFNANAALGYAG